MRSAGNSRPTGRRCERGNMVERQRRVQTRVEGGSIGVLHSLQSSDSWNSTVKSCFSIEYQNLSLAFLFSISGILTSLLVVVCSRTETRRSILGSKLSLEANRPGPRTVMDLVQKLNPYMFVAQGWINFQVRVLMRRKWCVCGVAIFGRQDRSGGMVRRSGNTRIRLSSLAVLVRA